jgi:hypothetical protein
LPIMIRRLGSPRYHVFLPPFFLSLYLVSSAWHSVSP